MKKKKLFLGVIILFVIIVVGVSFLVLKKDDNKESEKSRQIVTDFLAKYQMLDENCGEYLINNGKGVIEFEGFQCLLAEHMDFKINTVKKGKKYDIVEVEIKNVDFCECIEKIINEELVDKDAILENLETSLGNKKAPRKEFEVEIFVDNTENKILMTGDLSNALLGGYHEFVDTILEEAVQDEKNN